MMISSRFTRWLTLFALAATVAVALLLAQIRPLPPAGSNVVGENRFHVVENDGGSLEAIAKNITSGSGAVAGQPGRRSIRAPGRQRTDDSAANHPAGRAASGHCD